MVSDGLYIGGLRDSLFGPHSARSGAPFVIVLGRDAEVAAWVGARVTPGIEDFGASVAIGVSSPEEVLLAGAVYNNWRHPNIEITFAVESPKWASRAAIACILRYPFVQLGCLRITAFTASRNERARAFLVNPLIGFEQEGYHPNGFPEDDAVSYGLLRRNCRWLSPNERCPHSPDAN